MLGLEPDWRMYLDHLVEVFREVRRVLRPDGVLFLNMGDTYATGAGAVGERPGGGAQGERWRGGPPSDKSTLQGNGHVGGGPKLQRLDRVPVSAPSRGNPTDRLANGRGDQPSVHRMKTRANRDGTHAGKHTAMTAIGPMTQPNRMSQFGFKPKDRMMMPARLAIALQEDGWWLRDEIIFHKPNPMPSSVEDRTTPAHEMVYVLTKSARYYWDGEAIKEPFAESSVPRMGRAARREEPEPGGMRADLFDASGAAVANYRRPNEVLRDLAVKKITRKPQGWDVGPGGHSTLSHNQRGAGAQRFSGHSDGESEWVGTGRNRRSVWTIATEPFGGEYCRACRTYFEGEALRALRVEEVEREDGTKERRRWCSCGVYDRWLSHFATFPTKLLEPCLLAACPERCCSSCGRGWRRVMEEIHRGGDRIHRNLVTGTTRNQLGGQREWDEYVPAQTLGWEPDCECGAPPKPGVILDCFGGAGTVAVVAQRLGRDAVLCEISEDYAEMARQRIVGEQPLLARVELQRVRETDGPPEEAMPDLPDGEAAVGLPA